VLSDLLSVAKAALKEPGDGAKNVAAVLTAAAFEDVLRRLASVRGLPHTEHLQDVVTALKNAGALKGAEVSIAVGYLPFRNKALHANWADVDRPGVHSVAAFAEQLLTMHFS
jgi:hypothetical protein